MMFFKIWTQHHGSTLLCVCYRPQWQGREPIEFLHTHLDRLLQQYSCNHTVIVGDLNQHLVARAFEELLTVYGLTNHVTFPTHISGSSLILLSVICQKESSPVALSALWDPQITWRSSAQFTLLG
ncbi:hypothetical protein GWK47_025079 [Chionoecetes opilio]|uniref:Endonuclease/exonuclease/phosphatase domain-containing protein n=1 Tax=Chionoecetes opilio TaxID=41210 RepID=A0A8J4XKR1_CHIOP|nr:hypothetical protein GWK47_025079 [Chionoecetes opilio]